MPSTAEAAHGRGSASPRVLHCALTIALTLLTSAAISAEPVSGVTAPASVLPSRAEPVSTPIPSVESGAQVTRKPAFAPRAQTRSQTRPQVPRPGAPRLRLPPLVAAPVAQPVIAPSPSAAAHPPLLETCVIEDAPSQVDFSAMEQVSDIRLGPMPGAGLCLVAVSADSAWVQVYLSRSEGRLTFEVQPNAQNAPRSAVAHVATRTGSFEIRIRQSGQASPTPPSVDSKLVGPLNAPVAEAAVEATPTERSP